MGVVLQLLLLAPVLAANRKLVLGKQGESCTSACADLYLECVPSIDTSNTTDVFVSLGLTCSTPPAQGGKWWASDQPSYVSDSSDPNTGECLGYLAVPDKSNCDASMGAVERVCNCGDAIAPSNALTFGTGHAGVRLPVAETVVFTHVITEGHTGVMNHFWSTCSPQAENDMLVRYYVDGEEEASIQFHPPLAAGVGFDDGMAPWGTKWMGLGAGQGGGQAWFHNFKIPFGSSIKITVQATKGPADGFYIILRGGLDIPLVIGGITLPSAARMQLQRFQGSLDPLEVLDIAKVPAGYAGQFFMSTIAVANAGVGGLNFLEGCFHMFDPVTQPFPGTLLSTGTEDYYDSGWYFNAGVFHMPVSGFTHILANKTRTEWSAYRFHDMDPLRFADGFRLTWRCGDIISQDAGVGKCFTEAGGDVVGQPTCDMVQSYAWLYTWPKST